MVRNMLNVVESDNVLAMTAKAAPTKKHRRILFEYFCESDSKIADEFLRAGGVIFRLGLP